MGHEVLASIRLTLPDAPQQMASDLGEIAAAWAEFLSAIDEQAAEATFSVNETRAKPGPKPATNGTPRAPRKTRAAGSNSPPTDAAAVDAAQQE